MARTKLKSGHIDRVIGGNLRTVRQRRGYSQKELGTKLRDPLCYQQVAKYELGVDRLPAARMAEFAIILEVNVLEFFSGVESLLLRPGVVLERRTAAPSGREMKHLRNMDQLDEELRLSLMAMVEALAKQSTTRRRV